jgi:GH35 family endo-1,4-beta-xylanase
MYSTPTRHSQPSKGTWLRTWPVGRTNLPLPFDENLQTKPAYWGVVDPSQLPPSSSN